MNDYISKPINLDKLRGALQRWREWNEAEEDGSSLREKRRMEVLEEE
jgi:response regulator of citrate/malate metabolism